MQQTGLHTSVPKEAGQQIKYNNEAANKVYEQEQSKMSEAEKAAFAQQTALAKAIGSKVQFYLQGD